MNDGGRIVPESFEDAIHEHLATANPWAIRPLLVKKPLTIRQRFYLWRYNRWWSLHDLMFGKHEYDD